MWPKYKSFLLAKKLKKMKVEVVEKVGGRWYGIEKNYGVRSMINVKDNFEAK